MNMTAFSTFQERPLEVQATLWDGSLPEGWFTGELDAFWELLKQHGAKFAEQPSQLGSAGSMAVLSIKNREYSETLLPGSYIVFWQPSTKYPSGHFECVDQEKFERRFGKSNV